MDILKPWDNARAAFFEQLDLSWAIESDVPLEDIDFNGSRFDYSKEQLEMQVINLFSVGVVMCYQFFLLNLD